MPGFTIRIIEEAEAGVKVLRFLERKTGLSRPLLYRFFRKGQIRLNGHRVRPNVTLSGGDELKYPVPEAEEKSPAQKAAISAVGDNSHIQAGASLGNGLRIVYVDDTILVLDKAAGLPSQPGSGHEDAVSERLRAAFAGFAHIPAPAHRLDKESSGLLLAGMTHKAQQSLHALFAASKVDLQRDYLLWVSGCWPFSGAQLLEDSLSVFMMPSGREQMGVLKQCEHPCETPDMNFVKQWLERQGLSATQSFLSSGTALAVNLDENFPTLRNAEDSGQSARGVFVPLASRSTQQGKIRTLLCVRLLTGRKHQIRVQCAARGCPLVGDVKYGATLGARLLLHAAHIRLPMEFFAACGKSGGPLDFVSLPKWKED